MSDKVHDDGNETPDEDRDVPEFSLYINSSIIIQSYARRYITINRIRISNELCADYINGLNLYDENIIINNTNYIKKTRKVNELLGKNQTKDHEEIYEEIKKKIGPTKICNFGHTRGSKTGIKHEGEKVLPIESFELKGCIYDKSTKSYVINGCGLQGFCRDCSKRRRRKRLEQSKKNNTGGYQQYINTYGETKKCSMCKNVLHCKKFNLSPSMECGIHNICKKCSKIYGESLGDRWIRYLPDGNFKYKKTEEDQHDDHIFPLALGGSNEKINHQLINSKENLKKSSKLLFNNIHDIDEHMLSERWRNILVKCKEENTTLHLLESRLRKAINIEINHRKTLTNTELVKQFENYNKKWNSRKDIKRAVSIFRKL